MSSGTRIVLLVAVLALIGGGYFAYPSAKGWWDARSMPPAVDRQVSFAADVEPILEEHCYECHGDGKRKGRLSLESRDTLLSGGKSGAVITENDSADSLLIHRVSAIGGVKPMPPKSKPRLTPEQIGILRAWIDQGLPWSTGD